VTLVSRCSDALSVASDNGIEQPLGQLWEEVFKGEKLVGSVIWYLNWALFTALGCSSLPAKSHKGK